MRRSAHPEFDAWRWNQYWVELDSVVEFKRKVYKQALTELSRLLKTDPYHNNEKNNVLREVNKIVLVDQLEVNE